MKKLAARRVRMIVVLVLILGGAIALPRFGESVPGNHERPPSTPLSPAFAGTEIIAPTIEATRELTAVPTIVPPVVPLVAARAVGLRASEPTPTPIPPTATPAPVVPNGPLLTSRLVTFYGHPDNNRLGILGEFATPAAMIAKLKAQAAAYQTADPSRPAIPTIELIASVASDTPGDDGLYLNRTRLPLIEEYADIAAQNNCLLLLDIQLGYDSMANEVSRLA
ncbi:MAG TPA: hypothetical protein VIG44_02895, partial [Thermomicrobiales bacterium]